MNMTAHRSMVWASSPPPDPVPPVEPDGPGPKPPPKHHSAAIPRTFVSQGPGSPPGPLDPYVRRALERPVPGRLPPRPAFLSAVIIQFADHMTGLAEAADLNRGPEGEAGSIVIAGELARFVDDICDGTARMTWPFASPRPEWYPDVFSGADLIVMGTQFRQCAAIAMDPDVGRAFADVAHALLATGAARLG